MKRKEEAMKKYIASFLAICMIFVMVPILPGRGGWPGRYRKGGDT